jgi:predicted DNA-binding transcriptional regulator YafY
MPANKNALTRYALLDKLLSNKRNNYSIQDMTDYLASELPNYGQSPVTRRQVEKDLNYLEYDSPFDVEFERYKVDAPTSTGDGYYRKPCIRYADPSFSIFKKPLTDDELSLLSSVLSTLGSFRGLPNFEWLDSLASKLHLTEQSEIISMSKNISENSTLLAELFGAISSKSPIKLHYHVFGCDDVRTVDLSPYLLKEYNRRWYLLASPFDSDTILSFALDRVDSVEFNCGYKYKPALEDFTERFEDIIGVTFYENKPIERITFWVSAASKDYITTKPIHGSMRILKGDTAKKLQNEYPKLPEDGMFCTIDCMENYELIRELTMYGANLIVLSPSHIAEKVVGIAQDMVDAYKNINSEY